MPSKVWFWMLAGAIAACIAGLLAGIASASTYNDQRRWPRTTSDGQAHVMVWFDQNLPSKWVKAAKHAIGEVNKVADPAPILKTGSYRYCPPARGVICFRAGALDGRPFEAFFNYNCKRGTGAIWPWCTPQAPETPPLLSNVLITVDTQTAPGQWRKALMLDALMQAVGIRELVSGSRWWLKSARRIQTKDAYDLRQLYSEK